MTGSRTLSLSHSLSLSFFSLSNLLTPEQLLPWFKKYYLYTSTLKQEEEEKEEEGEKEEEEEEIIIKNKKEDEEERKTDHILTEAPLWTHLGTECSNKSLKTAHL